MHSQCPPGVRLEDRSEETALLAVQGPKSVDVLRGHVPDALLDLRYYHFGEGTIFGKPTGKRVECPPQSMSLTFNEEGQVTFYTGGYVMGKLQSS